MAEYSHHKFKLKSGKNDSHDYVFASNASDLKDESAPAGPRMRKTTIGILEKMGLSSTRKILRPFALATLFFCACTQLPSQPAVSMRAPHYQVINLGPQFEKFWQMAGNKTFEEQLHLWNEIIEKPYQDFYDAMVWQKKDNPNWEERKIRRLKEMFGKYPVLYSRMIEKFSSFDKTLSLQIEKFQKFFSDANFSLPIYAAATATFNGKGGEGGDSVDPLGKSVLAFGIDMMVEYNNDPDVLYSHELFHIYHTETIGVNEQVFLNQGRLTLPLWLEGLATYVSLQMNPSASMSAVLMDKDLPNVTDIQVKSIAKTFFSEADEKAFDNKKPEIYKKWFAIDPQYKLGSDLPHRCGYLLGLRVVQELAGNHSLPEMVHWKMADIHKNVVEALKKIAVATDLKNGLKSATPPDEVIPVSKSDIRILERASEILSTASKWNRHDNRECPEKESKVSLYCALYWASVEINGEFDHRLGALEEVRRTVEEASKGKFYEHRLMGYNNDPATKFMDIKNVLLKTARRVRLRFNEADKMAKSKETPFSHRNGEVLGRRK